MTIKKSELTFAQSKYSYVKYLDKYLKINKNIVDVFTGSGSIHLNFDNVKYINNLDTKTYYFNYNLKHNFNEMLKCYENFLNDISPIRNNKIKLEEYFRFHLNNTNEKEPLFHILLIFCKKMTWGGIIKYHQKTKTYKINILGRNKSRKILSDNIIKNIKIQLQFQH